VHNLALNGSVGTPFGPTWTYGSAGPELQFTSSNYIDTNESSRFQFAGGSFTTLFRIKPSNAATHHTFFSTLNYGANTGWLARSEGSGTYYRIVIGNTIYGLAAGATLGAGAGYLTLALTYVSGGSVSSYCNGKYIASVNIKAIISSGRNLRFGREEGVGYGYVGLLESMLVYDRLLTPNEIALLSRDLYLPFRTPISLRWRNLRAVSVSLSTVALSWTDNSHNEVGFSLERSAIGATAGFVEIQTLGVGVTSYHDTDLAAATYWYRLRSYDATGRYSDYSEVAEVTVT
jgi:hypothetical protein